MRLSLPSQLHVLYKWLNRRSQRRSTDWARFRTTLHSCWLPPLRIYHNLYPERLWKTQAGSRMVERTLFGSTRAVGRSHFGDAHRYSPDPHAACDVAGAGNGATDVPSRARRGKPRIQTRARPVGLPRQFSTLPTIKPVTVRSNLNY